MIYIEDEKKHVVYEYNVSRNVEKTIRALLEEINGCIYSDTLEGYTVEISEMFDEEEYMRRDSK